MYSWETAIVGVWLRMGTAPAHITGRSGSPDHGARAGVHSLGKRSVCRNLIKTLIGCLKFGHFQAWLGNRKCSLGAWLHGHVVPAHPLGKQAGPDHGAGAPSLLKRPACRNSVKT